MKLKRFVKSIGISSDSFSKIKKAVEDAETKTNGEIAVAVIKESDTYSGFELFASFICALIAFLILTFFAEPIYRWLSTLSWNVSISALPRFFIIVVSIIVSVLFALFNIPTFDRLIIPNNAKIKAVYVRAVRHFVESGIYKTVDRSGILIFISVLERRVLILADDGISSKIDQSIWDSICKDLIDSIKIKDAGNGLCKAIETCGTILSEYFPAKENNPNELSDGLVILDS